MPKQLEFFIYIFFLATDVMRGRLGAHLKFLPPVSPMDIILELLTQYNNKEVLFSQKVTPQKDFVFALCVAECSVLQCEVEKTQGRKYVVYVPKKFVTSVGYIHTCVVLAYEHNTQELN